MMMMVIIIIIIIGRKIIKMRIKFEQSITIVIKSNFVVYLMQTQQSKGSLQNHN